MMLAYFFSVAAAANATRQGVTDVVDVLKLATVSTSLISNVRLRSLCHGTRVKPTGCLQSPLSKPVISFVVETLLFSPANTTPVTFVRPREHALKQKAVFLVSSVMMVMRVSIRYLAGSCVRENCRSKNIENRNITPKRWNYVLKIMSRLIKVLI